MDYYGRTNYGYDNRHSMDRNRPNRGRTYPDHSDQRQYDRRGNGYRNSDHNQSAYQQKPESGNGSSCTSKTVTYAWLGVVTFVLLGSVALAGVALHYAVFYKEHHIYQLDFTMDFVPFDTNSQTVGSIGWLNIQKQTCTDALEVKIGSRLKRCRVVDISDNGGNTKVIINLLVTNAMSSSYLNEAYHMKTYSDSALYKMISTTPTLTPENRFVSAIMTQDAAGLTIAQGQRNNTAYAVVEKSMCNAIESKLGKDLYLDCYMKSAASNLLTVEFYVDRSALNDLLLDGVLKQRRNAENSKNVLKAKLNTGTLKIDAFANVLLQAKTVVVSL